MRSLTFSPTLSAALTRIRPAAASLAVMFACVAMPAIASVEEVTALLRQGQIVQALDRADRALVTNPKDRKLRFLKGVALAELNRLDEATGIFLKLTEEAPELPEPYNNLAVIYAQQKQYDKAKAALEMAIRTHPSYSVAHENLGDLYTKLARQAYDRALQLDAANTVTQTKLGLIREIISVGVRPTPAPSPAAAKPPVVAAAPAAPALAAKPAVKPAESANTQAAAPTPLTSSAPAAKPAAAAPPAFKEVPKAAVADEEEARKTALAWAAAWSGKNVRQYLSYYAADFRIPGGAKRADWEKERADRINKPGAIKVTLSNIRVSVDGDKATVRFRQAYESSTLDTSTNKTLTMVRKANRWQIQQERVGN